MCHLQQHLHPSISNPQNKFPIKNSHKQSFAWQPYLLLPTPALHPSAPHEDEEGHGDASSTGDMLPFPCGVQPPTALLNHSFPRCHAHHKRCPFQLQTCCFTQSHGSATKRQQERAVDCWTRHSFVDRETLPLPRLQPKRTMN